MKGLGFFIWNLEQIQLHLSQAQLASFCLEHGIKWVSFKVANGSLPYNQFGGSDLFLISYIEALRNSGIEAGGWAYCYPLPICYPPHEAKLYCERITTLRLAHFMYDPEAEWKKPGLQMQVKQICSMNPPPKIPMGVCSYRYPDYHPTIDLRSWTKQPSMDFVAPQVYWEGAHNVEAQLRKSYFQYRKFTNLPYYPIGCTYGRGTWSPNASDIHTFITVSRQLGFEAYGFYSLDWTLKHNRLDWLDAIKSHRELSAGEI